MAFHEQSFEIKALLFLSGFVILSLEILGIRILAPYVGTTTPVWAALLGVTLAGSAVGYYWGGVLADHVQKKPYFYGSRRVQVYLLLSFHYCEVC